MKVLLVDDDTKLTEVLTRGLGAEGFGVDVSHDGDDGWWKATEGTHDVIVLDIMMPKRNGFVLCADLRRAGIWTPILMLTVTTSRLPIRLMSRRSRPIARAWGDGDPGVPRCRFDRRCRRSIAGSTDR